MNSPQETVYAIGVGMVLISILMAIYLSTGGNDDIQL